MKPVLKNGLVVDSYGEGGIVQNVDTDKLHFWRDIGPHFMSTWVFIGIHVFFFFTGNMAVPLFLSLLRVAAHIILDDENMINRRNVTRKTEKLFMEDKRFAIPMVTCQLGGLVTWIWVLCLFSDDVKFDSAWLNMRPDTWQ